MDRQELQAVLKKHKLWVEGIPRGERANLSSADLHDANIDYSCWPLWCGSLDVTVDKIQMVQLIYHFVRLNCNDPEIIAAQNYLIPLANQFHRVDECGWVKKRAPRGAANTDEAQEK